VVVENVLERNWVDWFGTPLPITFSTPVSVSMDFLFLVVPLTVVHYVVTEDGPSAEAPTWDATT
jgi:hypothetical protein